MVAWEFVEQPGGEVKKTIRVRFTVRGLEDRQFGYVCWYIIAVESDIGSLYSRLANWQLVSVEKASLRGTILHCHLAPSPH